MRSPASWAALRAAWASARTSWASARAAFASCSAAAARVADASASAASARSRSSAAPSSARRLAEIGLEPLGGLGAVRELVEALGEAGVGAAQHLEALVGVEDEPLDALDRLGGNLLLAVAGLERLARLGDLLGEPLLALLEQPADLGDLGGQLGRHLAVHLRRLAARLGHLVRELLLALLEGGADLGELRLERGLALLEVVADRVQRLVGGALALQRLDGRAQLVDLAALVGGAQRGELGARGGGLVTGGGGVGAQLVGELAQRVEPPAGIGALAHELVEAAAIVAGQPLGLGLLDLDARDLLAQPLALAADLLDALQRGGELLAGGLALLLALALDALHERLELGARGARLVLALRTQALQLGACGLGGLGARALEPVDALGEIAAIGLGALFDGGEGSGEALLGGGHRLGAGALGGLDLLGELEADGLGLLGGLGTLVAGGGLVGQALLELPDAVDKVGLLAGVGLTLLKLTDALEELSLLARVSLALLEKLCLLARIGLTLLELPETLQELSLLARISLTLLELPETLEKLSLLARISLTLLELADALDKLSLLARVSLTLLELPETLQKLSLLTRVDLALLELPETLQKLSLLARVSLTLLELANPVLELGLLVRLGQALLELRDALQQLGLLVRERAADALEALDALLQRVLLGGVGGLLEARDALQQLGLLGRVGRGPDLVADALELLARLVDLALGLLRAIAAGLRLPAGLVERGGKVGGGLLEVLDALQRGEQAGDDRGGVVEVGDRVARDPGIGIEHLLGLEVGRGAARLAGGELVVDPRGGLERAEGDERAGRAPAVPRLRLGLERLAQRAHHDRVLLAHAHEHEVARQLEGEVLEEEREVEALVELDRDEDHLERERPLVRREDRADVLLRARAGGLAALEEAPPRLGVAGRVVDERVEQPLAQHLGGVEAEQQLGGLAPLGDRALAVGQDEEPVDQLREEAVERVVGTRRLVDVRIRGWCLLDGVHGRVGESATPPGARLPHGSPRPSPPRIGVPASW